MANSASQGAQPRAPSPASTTDDPQRSAAQPPPIDQLQALESGRWDSFDALFDEVNSMAKKIGFYISKRRACNYGPDGKPRRRDLHCGEGKNFHPNREPTGKRAAKSSSMKKKCEWKAKAVFKTGDANKWTFSILAGQIFGGGGPTRCGWTQSL